MEKKQSSIDILMKAILQSDVELYISMQESGEFEQIKAMHKEEMRDLYLTHVTKAERLRKIFEKQFEELYNETFGGNNE